MGNPKRWLKAVSDLELALPKNDSKNNYIVHNSVLRFPEFLKNYPFDGIILNSTFLDARHQRERLNRIKREYNFIKYSSAVKIALAQDDYDCNLELDHWMLDWDVDYFYSVIHEFSSELFPNYSQNKGAVLKGYTGYISDEHIELAKRPKRAIEERKINVGYRATNVVTNLNKLVILKAQIGGRFKKAFAQYNLQMDISTRNEDRIYGSKWFSFIENCQFMIGTNSGSSLVIPDLNFREEIQKYMATHRDWSYEDVKELFFPVSDENINYTAISPRNIEAAVLDTCQINTTLGDYSGVLNPWEHFIPLKEDCSNHEEVFQAMNDASYVKKMVDSASESLLSHDDLRLSNFVKFLLSRIELKSKEHTNKSFYELKNKYNNYIRPLERVQWSKDLLKEKIKKFINYKTRGNRIS